MPATSTRCSRQMLVEVGVLCARYVSRVEIYFTLRQVAQVGSAVEHHRVATTGY